MAVRQRSLCRQNLLAKERIEIGGATRLRVDATSEQFLRSPVTHESLFLGAEMVKCFDHIERT